MKSICGTENCLDNIFKKKKYCMNAFFMSSGCSVRQRHQLLDPPVVKDAHLVTHKHTQCEEHYTVQWVCNLRELHSYQGAIRAEQGCQSKGTRKRKVIKVILLQQDVVVVGFFLIMKKLE